MSVYIGPCNYGTPEDGERFITADSSSEPSKVISVVGNLDMKQHRIINVQDPRDGEPNDAATAGHVDRLASYIWNNKVDYAGGIMTGELNLDSHKLTHVGDPDDDEDAVNKRYLNQVLLKTRPYDLGRFLVFPHADESKSYFAVGSKRTIDLDDAKYIEYFNDSMNLNGNVIGPSYDRTLYPVEGKNSKIMYLNSQVSMNVQIEKPWTLLFSIKPDDPPSAANDLILNFRMQAPGIRDQITISWSQNRLTYHIGGQDPVMVDIDTSILNHFAFEYSDQKLVFWVNGASRKTHSRISLNRFIDIRIGANFIGILSIYNRKLSRQEIIEHFVQYHVKNFTDDEVFA